MSLLLLFNQATTYIDTGIASSVAGASSVDSLNAVDTTLAQGVLVADTVTLWGMVEIGLAQSTMVVVATEHGIIVDLGLALAVFWVSGADLIPSSVPTLTMPTKIRIVNSGETQVTLNDS